jgi:hypothetical protein
MQGILRSDYPFEKSVEEHILDVSAFRLIHNTHSFECSEWNHVQYRYVLRQEQMMHRC